MLTPTRSLLPALLFGALFALCWPVSPLIAQETQRFSDVHLADGNGVYDGAQIQVRVKESSGSAYTRADYFDADGRPLGFYEAFEVVSREPVALREWALQGFADRTASSR